MTNDAPTPVSRRSLGGAGVLVTRPAGQNDRLCELVRAQGGRAIEFPAIEIVPAPDLTRARALIEGLESYRIVVFVSPNAVRYGLPLFPKSRRAWPEGVSIAAVGRSTAGALEQAGLSVTLCPEDHYDSESLLSLEAMQEVFDQRILIVRGEGGRELLAEVLRARGARVEYAEVYRRVRPRSDPGALLAHWERGEIQVVVTTSNEGLENLYALVGETGRPWLLETPLITVSRRAAELALGLGFRHAPIIAPGAGDEPLMATLLRWRAGAV